MRARRTLKNLAVAAAFAMVAGLAAVPAGAQSSRATTETQEAQARAFRARESRPRDEVRELARQAFERYPPNVGQAIKLDPALLSNEAYLAPYPDISTLLSGHPEIARSPDYYLEFVQLPQASRGNIVEELQWRYMSNILDGIGIGLIFGGIGFVLLWSIRHFLAHRRWLRSTRLHMDIHNRLMERLQNGDDVKKYLESAGATRLLADAPAFLSSGSVGSPANRILIAVQIGVIAACASVGLLLVKNWMNAGPAAADTMLFFGVIGLSLGVGFALSAVASYALSRRFGLLITPEGAPADAGRS